MKRAVTLFLQTAIVLLGIAVLTALLLEPQSEGRNVNATQFEIYFNDPFLAYIYLAFIPFFVGLFQAFRILGHARRGELFSQYSVRSLRIIKYCASMMAVMFVGALAYIFIFVRGEDDIAGGVAMGLFIIFLSGVTAIATGVLERSLRSGVDKRSENDLA